jgi:hypothetical protein
MNNEEDNEKISLTKILIIVVVFIIVKEWLFTDNLGEIIRNIFIDIGIFFAVFFIIRSILKIN